jgi:hypothetical protein
MIGGQNDLADLFVANHQLKVAGGAGYCAETVAFF